MNDIISFYIMTVTSLPKKSIFLVPYIFLVPDMDVALRANFTLARPAAYDKQWLQDLL